MLLELREGVLRKKNKHILDRAGACLLTADKADSLQSSAMPAMVNTAPADWVIPGHNCSQTCTTVPLCHFIRRTQARVMGRLCVLVRSFEANFGLG